MNLVGAIREVIEGAMEGARLIPSGTPLEAAAAIARAAVEAIGAGPWVVWKEFPEVEWSGGKWVEERWNMGVWCPEEWYAEADEWGRGGGMDGEWPVSEELGSGLSQVADWWVFLVWMTYDGLDCDRHLRIDDRKKLVEQLGI